MPAFPPVPIPLPVEIDNLPAEYPLPAGQITALTPQTNALTDAQLRASPVPVSAAALPLPSGAATAANQSIGNTALAAIQASNAQQAFGVNDVDEASATVLYVGKSDRDGIWLVQKIDSTSGIGVGWATMTNNVGYLTYAAAWTARASLTYGRFDEAY